MNLGCMVSLTGQKTIFPFYHVVSGVALPHIKHLYYYRDEAEFEHDLDGMLKMFAPISIDQYLNGESGSRTKKQMVLSFDDGLVECHQFIAPLLKQKGVPALFFLNNNFIDNRGMFFRYRASILIEKLLSDDGALTEAAGYLVIPEDQVVKAILMIRYNQQPLLDALVTLVDIDYSAYLTHQKVYMSSEQVKDLIGWG
ncbi:MAG: polysaccharide deacetylase family protein, partial [Bacteroidales bacterium]|nr:polysaccharide deacetylase family protein [Bacteroidales bacterium]